MMDGGLSRRDPNEALSLAGLINAATGLTRGDADQLYQSWIATNTSHPLLYVAHFNRSTLAETDDGEAGTLAALRQSIALNPDFLPAYVNLGRTLERLGQPDQAVETWLAAAGRSVGISGLNIQYVLTALKQAIRVLAAREAHERAEEVARLCLRIDPRQEDVLEQFLALRLSQCRTPVLEDSADLPHAAQLRFMHPLSAAIYKDDPYLQLALAARQSRTLLARDPGWRATTYPHAPAETKTRRIRVGYLSSDFRDHAVGYLMASMFALHNRTQFEITAFHTGSTAESAITQRIHADVEHWQDLHGLDDTAAANTVAAAGLDILVDVNGHTRDARPGILARRPAPVLVNWLGFAGSMGSALHHYIIADATIIPRGAERFYSEQVLRLPCYQPNDRARPVADANFTRAALGLPEAATVLCCFNGTQKISTRTLACWAAILTRAPDAVLWLLDAPGPTRERISARLQAQGVAGNRIIFAPRLRNEIHLARYPFADLFLDTMPYGAHTTASDALWMGVPVLTRAGVGFAARVCASLVRAAGLPEMVTETDEDYIARAVQLATNRPARARLRARLQAGRDKAVLFDTPLLVRKLETLFTRIQTARQAGRLPRPELRNLAAYLESAIALDSTEGPDASPEATLAGHAAWFAQWQHLLPAGPDGKLITGA